jgi:hypothetical protein
MASSSVPAATAVIGFEASSWCRLGSSFGFDGWYSPVEFVQSEGEGWLDGARGEMGAEVGRVLGWRRVEECSLGG